MRGKSEPQLSTCSTSAWLPKALSYRPFFLDIGLSSVDIGIHHSHWTHQMKPLLVWSPEQRKTEGRQHYGPWHVSGHLRNLTRPQVRKSFYHTRCKFLAQHSNTKIEDDVASRKTVFSVKNLSETTPVGSTEPSAAFRPQPQGSMEETRNQWVSSQQLTTHRCVVSCNGCHVHL